MARLLNKQIKSALQTKQSEFAGLSGHFHLDAYSLALCLLTGTAYEAISYMQPEQSRVTLLQ